MNQTVKQELKSPEISNKLLARFMGWTYDYSGIHWAVPTTDNLIPESENYRSGTRLLDGELMFHKSWDWLIPVIEKISKLNLPDPDGSSEDWQPFPRTFGMINDENGNFMFRFNRYGLHEAPVLIDAAYSAVVEFLEGYMKTRKAVEYDDCGRPDTDPNFDPRDIDFKL